jgi:hypothetical protein
MALCNVRPWDHRSSAVSIDISPPHSDHMVEVQLSINVVDQSTRFPMTIVFNPCQGFGEVQRNIAQVSATSLCA